jgi:glyoxylase-like metal-dependent hydrolase (beta-lactamase superfamily II)
MKIERFPVGAIQTNSYLLIDDNADCTDGAEGTNGANGANATNDIAGVPKPAALFDPGAYSQKISDYIKTNNIELKYIILTHGHGDHILGIPQFRELYPDALLLAGENETELLSGAMNNHSYDIGGKSLVIEPDQLLKDGDTVKLGNLELYVIYTPGHTKGGISILVDGMLFSGDTLFRDSIGRTDLAGGSYPQIIDSIKKKLMVLDDDVQVLPGHMESSTIGHEKKYNPYL